MKEPEPRISFIDESLRESKSIDVLQISILIHDVSFWRYSVGQGKNVDPEKSWSPVACASLAADQTIKLGSVWQPNQAEEVCLRMRRLNQISKPTWVCDSCVLPVILLQLRMKYNMFKVGCVPFHLHNYDLSISILPVP